ncbi:hypothetical protein RJ639_042013 [Escallonia herrerae]|uniref:DEP domain-containing protein n=1 Tax=Escallonia herrerae TaxID=1293975 RepID=A0AA88WI46_9ASTE|nr:hypothetical protein RJ639_042013 [Escallonia herrerae]
MEKEDSIERPNLNAKEADTADFQKDHQEIKASAENVLVGTLTAQPNAPDSRVEDWGNGNASKKSMSDSPTQVSSVKDMVNTPEMEENASGSQKEDLQKENPIEKSSLNSPSLGKEEGVAAYLQKDDQVKEESSDKNMSDCLSGEISEGELDVLQKDQVEPPSETKTLKDKTEVDSKNVADNMKGNMVESVEVESENPGVKKNLEEVLYEEEEEPVFDGTEVPGMEANRSSSTRSLDLDPETQGSAWPEKAVALTNFVRKKSVVAVSSVLQRLSGKSDDGQNVPAEDDKNNSSSSKEVIDSPEESLAQEVAQKSGEKSGWNPLSLIRMSREVDPENKAEHKEEFKEEPVQPIAMKGRIILYTRLGCQDCKEARLFLHRKRLRYVEINIDVYPSRKLELEKIAGSSAVPRVFFNEVRIGGLSELKGLEDSGKLDEKIEYLITEGPSFEAPLPPLSAEDDISSTGSIDELAVIVRKMKEIIVVKDRFYKLRRFTNCFLGSEAVDFLSEDQYLEREEAIEFGRKLGSKLFFQHVLDENVFEDGNHLYRFLDHDPIVSQCQNLPRGITELKPKPIIEISSRLRFLSYAIFEAYMSEDGKHVDYRSIHGSEEFARYLRIVEELQRVDLHDMPREEKLAFFVNLYNMMTIHAILVWGHPAGALERRKLLGDFKYVIGGCTYSLSAIHHGILRANQRPPYNLIKPFGVKDKRCKVALTYSEPLVHFALVSGNRSGPALRCYSPGNIDKELMEAARGFLRSGGLLLDLHSKVASVSKILRWYSSDFGKNEVEVLRHAANYLEPSESQALLELLAITQLKVVYQPYDWGLNY